MRRRDVAAILLTVGVLCGVISTLLNLNGIINTRLGNLMLYAGIVAIAAGLVILGTAGSKR